MGFAPTGKRRLFTAHAKIELMHRSNQQPYSITSSAVASSLSGMVTPSAFAVLRFIRSSNVVGSSIGKSPGFAPLKILSTYEAARRKEPMVARTIGKQTACISEFPETVDSGKPVLQAKVGKFLDMTVHKRIGENDERLCLIACHSHKGRIDPAW